MEALINKNLFEDVISHGNKSPANEICGALLGSQTSKEKIIKKYKPLTNISERPSVHYIPDPNEWVKVLQQTSKLNKNAKYDLIGIFHTHPNHQPIASHTDIYEAGYEGVYWIYSPKYKESKAYYYDGDEDNRLFKEITLKVRDKR